MTFEFAIWFRSSLGGLCGRASPAHRLLQRPLLIDELDVNSWYAMGSRTGTAYRGKNCQLILLTGEANETTSGN